MVKPCGGPRTIEDIDASWVGGELRRGGWIDADVTDVDVDVLGEGVGLLGALARVRLAYRESVVAMGNRNPSSVIAKLPAANAQNRHIAEHFGYYEREAGVYRYLLPRPGIETATCYSVTETSEGLPCFLLEDLGHLDRGDQLAGASPDEARWAADALASIHAGFWEDPRLRRQVWLPGPSDAVINGYGELFTLMWPTFVSRYADRIPAEHLAAAPLAIERFDEVCRSFSLGAITLVHGDFRLDNLLFDRARGVAAPVDWQLAAWGRGAYDLAFFCAGSIDTPVRREIEAELVERFHAGLVARGVDRYSLAECRRDFDAGMVMNLPNPVTAAVAVDPGNQRGRELLARNAERALAAVADR